MNCRTASILFCATILTAISPSNATHAQTNPFTKGQVADRIRKVEDGVDEFEKYLKNRGEDAKRPGGIGTEQWRDNAPPAFKFSKHAGAGEPSEGNKRRSRKCYGRFKSHLEPTSAQVRSNFELSGDKGANGTGYGQRAPRQPGDNEGKIRHTGRTILGCFAHEYQ